MELYKNETERARGPAIEEQIVRAVLSGRIAPGERLGEKEIGDIFGVSRTLVRESMIRLSSRGLVDVLPRRGWFVVEPSIAEAREIIEARRTVEIGMIISHADISPAAIQRLRLHYAAQKQALDDKDLARRSYLLGHFHVHIADVLGNSVLAEILENLTARTVLISALYQSDEDASHSCNDHGDLIDALECGDQERAKKITYDHLTHLEKALSNRTKNNRDDRLAKALDLKNF
ncbi:GntR family transcriptional regulator [Neokomagataea thailandica NBRC 106555]|uniref:GntR family transcriptional regulator n=2 Tax=Neokomagataea TaxID=1223423 RepID=A0A4Y6VAD2_9PROT|nr:MULTISPECIES: GntR family transcriptional regulator [Neokomagataea]QDH25476.1 GntR family transcriptional regulator [Neokomagataea tanensis]GBR53617.1 GntR family transcriptional regulator [Neokomagataea thailandica NBRC 106555]